MRDPSSRWLTFGDPSVTVGLVPECRRGRERRKALVLRRRRRSNRPRKLSGNRNRDGQGDLWKAGGRGVSRLLTEDVSPSVVAPRFRRIFQVPKTEGGRRTGKPVLGRFAFVRWAVRSSVDEEPDGRSPFRTPSDHAARRVAPRTGGAHGALRGVRHAGAVFRHPGRTRAVPRTGGAVRCVPHGAGDRHAIRRFFRRRKAFEALVQGDLLSLRGARSATPCSSTARAGFMDDRWSPTPGSPVRRGQRRLQDADFAHKRRLAVAASKFW